MKHEDRERIAIWRFGFIAPALNNMHGYPSNAAYFRTLEGKKLRNPVTGQVSEYCKGTFENWLSRYKRNGLEALMPGSRSDSGTFRTLDENAQNYIIGQLEKYPRILNTVIKRRLEDNGIIKEPVSQSTVDRFIKSYRMKNPKKDEYHDGKDRKAFEFEYANQMWQADTTYLSRIDGQRVYLVMILDDASRMAVGFEAFLADNAVNFQKVLKNAIRTNGVPSILFVDNGSPYSNHQLQRICAGLGIQLVHTPVRDGSAKGKIEKSFSTLKKDIFYCEDWSVFKSIDEINQRIHQYIWYDYNTKNHGSKETDKEGNLLNARERFLRDQDRFRYCDEEDLDRIFLHTCRRKVRTDATIRYDSVFYEVPMEYIGETVTLVIDPMEALKAWIRSSDDQGLIPVSVLDRKANRKVQRRQHMKIGGE